MDVSISKALIDSNISHEQLILTKNVLIEFHDMKKEIINSNNKSKSETIYKTILSFVKI